MKKILIILLTIIIILLISCVNLEEYTPIEEYNSKLSELEEANSTIDIRDGNIADLEEEVESLEEDLDLTEEELIKYKSLINNLNELLSCVYIGNAENEKWKSGSFTAFSISHNDKTYIVTVGHCVENEYGKFYNFKFRANFSNNWIYPKLLAYENDYYNNRDYAIFYSDKVIDGLNYDLNSSYPKFILGNMNDNTLKEFSIYNLIEGESGSPILDIDGKVIGIVTGLYTDIDLVIEAIDNLE